jgi:parallel beta helix pectate lyase-like protein
MQHALALVVFLTWMLSVPPLGSATTYYLKPSTGNDANSGTSTGSPWKTMQKVKTTVTAGDTVNILGGTYTPSQYQGESGVPAWTESQSLGSAGNPIIIQANPGDTAVFDGQAQNYWMNFSSTNAGYAGHYVVIRNLTFQHFRGIAINAGDNTHHIAVLTCTLRDFGLSTTGALDSGQSHHVIFRGNTLTNIGDPTLPGDGITNSQHPFYVAEGSQFVVIENNYLEKNAGYGVHAYGHANFAFTTKNIIVRNNTIVNSYRAPMIFAATNFQNIYVYQNTIYQENPPFPAIDNALADSYISFHNAPSDFVNAVIKNNIGSGSVQVGAVYKDTTANFHGGPGEDYNRWENLADPTKIALWDATFYTLTNFQSATGLDTHSGEGTPLFGDATNRNFTLQSTSLAIDAGTFLTTTVGAGSGTTLTVADAGYFMDGFGLVVGDTIQVGAQSPVQLTAVNYGTNVLTLASSRTWSNGQGVSLPYNGTKPDLGAYEFASGPPGAMVFRVGSMN